MSSLLSAELSQNRTPIAIIFKIVISCDKRRGQECVRGGKKFEVVPSKTASVVKLPSRETSSFLTQNQVCALGDPSSRLASVVLSQVMSP
jgi:hypothetical protein